MNRVNNQKRKVSIYFFVKLECMRENISIVRTADCKLKYTAEQLSSESVSMRIMRLPTYIDHKGIPMITTSGRRK